MRTIINNPAEAPKQLGSWLAVWDYLKANNLHNEEIAHLICEDVHHVDEYGNRHELRITLTEYKFTRDHVIRNAFLEIESAEPRNINDNIMYQGLCSVELFRQYGLHEFAAWVGKFMYREKHNQNRRRRMRVWSLKSEK